MVQMQTWSKVFSNLSYRRLCPCTVTSRGNYISSYLVPVRPCEHLNSCDIIIIIIDIILPRARTPCGLYLSARAMRFSPPVIEHPPSVCVCVLETQGERDQIPGIAVSQHPSISQSPLIPSIKSPPHSQTVPSSRPPITTSVLLNTINTIV